MLIAECSDPNPANGKVTAPRGFTYGEEVFISCDSGYILIGESYLACKDGPAWSGNASCLKG